METRDDIAQIDHNEAFNPITLTISHQMHVAGTGHLTDMISAWHQEHDMRTALLTAPPCLCLQIDRFHQEITKSACDLTLESEVQLPVFTNAGIQVDTVGYIPVAGAAHTGSDLSGHCQSILRMQPTVVNSIGPAAWLLTNDDVPPQPVWKQPEWVRQNLVMIWLIRTDCMRLPSYVAPLAFCGNPDITQPDDMRVSSPASSTQMGTHVPDLTPEGPTTLGPHAGNEMDDTLMAVSSETLRTQETNLNEALLTLLRAQNGVDEV